MWTRHVVLPKRKIYPLCYSYCHLVDSISSLCYYIWIFCAPVALPFKMLYIFLHGRSSEFKKCWRTKLMCNRILYTLILHKYNPTLAGDSLQLATILQNIKKKKFCLMMQILLSQYGHQFTGNTSPRQYMISFFFSQSTVGSTVLTHARWTFMERSRRDGNRAVKLSLLVTFLRTDFLNFM